MEIVPVLVILVFWLAITIVVALLLVGIKTLVIHYLKARVKDEFYKNAPKVDSNLCDKGHLYPADLALKLKDVPGLESDVDLCPVCYDINMKTAEKILNE